MNQDQEIPPARADFRCGSRGLRLATKPRLIGYAAGTEAVPRPRDSRPAATSAATGRAGLRPRWALDVSQFCLYYRIPNFLRACGDPDDRPHTTHRHQSTPRWTKRPSWPSASLLPIIRSFAAAGRCQRGHQGQISLAGRILARVPRPSEATISNIPRTTPCESWASWSRTPGANVIKLPQHLRLGPAAMLAAIRELQGTGLQPFPTTPKPPLRTPRRTVRRTRYDAIKGSAVKPGPCARGNSGPGARAKGGKALRAGQNPHRMGDWSSDSKTRVAAMPEGIPAPNESSATLDAAAKAKDRADRRRRAPGMC